MANNVGRPRGLPKSPNSGRKKGVTNSKPITPEAVRERIRLDIIAAYEAEGGVEWLKKIIRDHPLAFLSQAFSRVAPVPPKPDDALPSTTVNVNQLNTLEMAKYIAFALNSALHENPARVIEHQPGPVKAEKPLPPYEPPTAMPEPAVDIEKLKAEELVRNTKEETISSYAGSNREQGITKRRNLL